MRAKTATSPVVADVNRTEFRKLLRLSALGSCMARLGYTVLQPKSLPPKPMNHRFTDGHFHEYEVKHRLAAAGVLFEAGILEEAVVSLDILPDWQVMGHLDGIVGLVTPITTENNYKIGAGRYILEVKSMSSGPWWKFVKDGYRKGFPSYYDQIQAYLHSSYEGMEDVTQRADRKDIAALYGHLAQAQTAPLYNQWGVVIPPMGLIAAKNKESGEVRYEVVRPDPGYMDTVIQRWQEADAAVYAGRVPERFHEDPNNYECRECPWFAECWDGQLPGNNITVVDDPDVDEASRTYTLGKMLERKGKELQDGAKSKITPTQPGKYKMGIVTVNQYERSSTTWDHKAIEQLLGQVDPTGQVLAGVKSTTKAVTNRIDIPDLDEQEVQALLTKLVNDPSLLQPEENHGDD